MTDESPHSEVIYYNTKGWSKLAPAFLLVAYNPMQCSGFGRLAVQYGERKLEAVFQLAQLLPER